MSWPPSLAPARPPLTALAAAALVLGALAVIFSPILVGGVAGLFGVALALVYLRKGAGHRTMALWGGALCTLGIVMSSGMGYVYYRAFWEHSAQQADGQAAGDNANQGSDETAGWVGTAAPTLVLTTVTGERIDLTTLKGRKVVINFWATWCRACREEMPALDRLAGETDDQDLVVVAVSDEDAKTLSAYARKQKLTLPLASADDLPAPFGQVQTIPTTVFIDRQGVITASHTGALSAAQMRTLAFAPDHASEVKAAPPPASR
jgi:peroxiredoxin